MDSDDRDAPGEAVHVGGVVADVLKEIARRVELRARLSAEWGREPTDAEFLAIAERESETKL
jgi:hypothetical protein